MGGRQHFGGARSGRGRRGGGRPPSPSALAATTPTSRTRFPGHNQPAPHWPAKRNRNPSVPVSSDSRASNSAPAAPGAPQARTPHRRPSRAAAPPSPAPAAAWNSATLGRGWGGGGASPTPSPTATS